MRSIRFFSMFCAFVMTTSLYSISGTITNSVVIDLSKTTITADGSGGKLIQGLDPTLVPITSFTPQVGDTLVISITFANNARLKIINGPNAVDSTGPEYFESLTFYYFDQFTFGYHTSYTTNVIFEGLQGNLTTDFPGGSSTGVLAQSLYPDFTDSYISFTGLTMTTTVQGLPNPGSQSYSQFGLGGGRAGDYEILSDSPSVPEPSTMVIGTLFGLGGIVARKRYRK